MGETAAMQLPKSHWAYEPALANLYPHDPAKARALLRASELVEEGLQ